MIPQIILTLDPSGALIAELPGVNGMRRQIPITSLESISRILHAQLGRESVELGTDGSPTTRQVRHWERHHTFPDPQCPFCIRSKPQLLRQANQAQAMKTLIEFDDSGLTKVRRVPAQSHKLTSPSRGAQISSPGITLKDLGL